MSDALEKYRTVMLDEGTGDTAQRSKTVTLVIGAHELDVEVRTLTLTEYESTGVPQVCYDENGDVKEAFEGAQEATLINAHRVAKCCYTPDGQRIFTEPNDIRQLMDAPYNASGWIGRLFNVIQYLHGFRKIAPDGIQDQRLAEVADTAEQLERVAKADDEQLDEQKVASIAGRVKTLARYLDQGSGKKPPTR